MNLLLILLTSLSTMIHKGVFLFSFFPYVSRSSVPPVNTGKLEICGTNPLTGYYRDGFCKTNQQDRFNHSICAVMTQEFLDYSLKMGNDLVTAKPENKFPGLKPGDVWCVCARRWKEAYDANVAPPVKLDSTHIDALKIVKKEELEKLKNETPTEKKNKSEKLTGKGIEKPEL
eukprot:GHVN01064558.1.p1 GENE.GHVN01064558.1~~GHVN01064558.1.p1  ORF type:complete len:173 (-),score=7.63 GHVN01064558.1:1223-1741(-)